MADAEVENLLLRVHETLTRIGLRGLLMARGCYYDEQKPAPHASVTNRDDVTEEVTKLRDAMTLRDGQIVMLRDERDAAKVSLDALQLKFEHAMSRIAELQATDGGNAPKPAAEPKREGRLPLTPAERAKAYRERKQRDKRELSGYFKNAERF